MKFTNLNVLHEGFLMQDWVLDWGKYLNSKSVVSYFLLCQQATAVLCLSTKPIFFNTGSNSSQQQQHENYLNHQNSYTNENEYISIDACNFTSVVSH